MKIRYASIPAVLVAIALLAAGCGGGGGSGADPASLAPPKSPVFVEATLKPEGSVKSNIEALAQKVAGIDDIGETVSDALQEEALAEGEPLDFEKEVQPWLGEKAGIFLGEYDGENFQQVGAALEVSDSGEAQEFIDKRAKTDSGEKPEKGSFEGVDFLTDEESTLGIIGDFVAFADSEADFKAMVEASNGESLSEEDTYTEAAGEVPDESIADVFVDIGGLVHENAAEIDSETELGLKILGIEPEGSTAIASLIPGSDQVELDVSSDVYANVGSGDGSKLLGSLPGGSFAAAVAPEYGKFLTQTVQDLNAEGIPGQIEPGELEPALQAAGIDLKQLTSSIGSVAVFAQGNTEANLNGAVVIETTSDKEATNTVSNIGLLLRASQTPGVTAIGGNAAGFSIRGSGIGPKPLVVAAEGKDIVISYGLKGGGSFLAAGGGSTLATNPEFEAAKKALGDTPISTFVSGGPALTLIESVLSPEEETELEEARPYLEKISFIATGTSVADEKATARVIVGFEK
jgi:hypothetical protein